MKQLIFICLFLFAVTYATDITCNIKVLYHTKSVAPVNSVLYKATVTTLTTASLYIEYYPTSNPSYKKNAVLRTPSSACGRTHTLYLARLVQNTGYTYNIYQESGDLLSSGTFTTGALPRPLNETVITRHGVTKNPLRLSSYPFVFYQGLNAYMYIWDVQLQQIVWYAEMPHPTNMFSGYGFRKFGNEYYVNRQDRFTIYNVEGQIVKEYVEPNGCGIYHHEMWIEDEGESVLSMGQYLVYPKDTGLVKTQLADNLLRWKPYENNVEVIALLHNFINATTERTAISDLDYPFYTPCENLTEAHPQDWLHTNSFTRSYHPNGYLVVSARSTSTVYIFDRYGKQLLYKVGGPDSHFTFPNASDHFHEQHSVYLLEDFSLIMFDNGFGRPASEGGFYSRALHLHLDTVSMTATKDWEYRMYLNDKCTAPFIGSAKRLYNKKGYLINFPTCDAAFGFPATSYDAELDLQGKQISLTSNYMTKFKGNYRSEDVDSVAGEYYVE